ncbi:MAG TPA: metallopeptidase family protein [Ktedonobacteraceae bacterium]|nr:metallopeptidase family protein [Ktedonobacteraceae bacterium]
MGELEEEYDYQREIEPDKHTLNENMNRSRYFFAMICFLIALILLGIYFDNYYDILSGWLLLAGVLALGAMGVFFLLSNTSLNHHISQRKEYLSNGAVNAFMKSDDQEHLEEGEDSDRKELSPFEKLVHEALATIPPEFHEQMENVLVRVQYEPGEEVIDRVGVKNGYTLLGLYEGVPLTTYGQARMSHPEIITIYESSIVDYCHGDPDRIRRQVRHTVLHEVAHHFGIDHEEMPIWIR